LLNWQKNYRPVNCNSTPLNAMIRRALSNRSMASSSLAKATKIKSYFAIC
jgi:hypothetical protein